MRSTLMTLVGHNCRKNNVECEGYAARREWQPGKKALCKASSKLPASDLHPLIFVGARRLNLSNIPLAPSSVFAGLESDIDRLFFNHYCTRLSFVLSTRGDEPKNNPFLSLIIPLASDAPVLMHSLLGLSGAHLLRFERSDEYQESKEKHRDTAISMMSEAVRTAHSKNANVSDAIVACLVLQYQLQVIEGDFTGEYKSHYQFAFSYIKFRPDEPIGRFAWEFFQYAHITISMTSLHPYRQSRNTDEGVVSPHELKFAIPGVTDNFDGVMLKLLSGIFPIITRITAVRDEIRSRKAECSYQPIKYQHIMEGVDLDRMLSQWDSGQEENSLDWLTAELYREATLVYLHRTIRASEPDEGLATRVQRGVKFLEHFPESGSHTNCVLLLPTFIFGCAAFNVKERQPIESVFDRLAASNDFGNVEPSKKIVQKVWEMMDNGDPRSWDWETIRQGMNYDFPIT